MEYSLKKKGLLELRELDLMCRDIKWWNAFSLENKNLKTSGLYSLNQVKYLIHNVKIMNKNDKLIIKDSDYGILQ
jgi:hypothetical protein